MDWKSVLAIVLVTFVVFIVLAMVTVTVVDQGEKEKVSSGELEIIELGRAGDAGYAVYKYSGTGNVSMLSMKSQPEKDIFVLEEEGLEVERFDEFVERLMVLEKYGYTINTVGSWKKLRSGIYIVPNGAMPYYVLQSMEAEGDSKTVIYIGSESLSYRNGVKNEEWYDPLEDSLKDRIVMYNGTLDQMMEKGTDEFVESLLYNSWAVEDETVVQVKGEGMDTAVIGMDGNQYVRILYYVGNVSGLKDSRKMPSQEVLVDASPEQIFPWEKTALMFTINRSNGTAYFVIEKDGKVKVRDKLDYVSEENVFLKRVKFESTGNYIVKVIDDRGKIGGGTFNIKELNVDFVESIGRFYTFSVYVNDEPVDGEKVTVGLKNSTNRQEFFISNGKLTVPAKLDEGLNTFEIEVMGRNYEVDVLNDYESIFDFYFKWGIPALGLVAIAIIIGRMSRKPVYSIRVGDFSRSIRKEISVPVKKAESLFSIARSDLGIKGPLTSKEFSFALKRNVTDGADVADGNVEELLKKMSSLGIVENYRSYYQLSGEGDVRRNTLLRVIKEILIENGKKFTDKKRYFSTRDYDIGLFGDNFNRKAVIVFEDEYKMDSEIKKLNIKERAKLSLREKNGLVRFATIDSLKDVL